MTERKFLARQLAAALLAVPWSHAELAARIKSSIRQATRSTAKDLAADLIKRNTLAYPPSPQALEAMLLSAPAFNRMFRAAKKSKSQVRTVLDPPRFAPSQRFAALDIPRLATTGDLADWLGLDAKQLDWFADSRRSAAATTIPVLQHYRHAFIAKRRGQPRLLEQPKPLLMNIQRKILREILDDVPSHDAAHGFVRGRSCITAAQVHACEHLVITIDLRDFFLSTPIERIHGTFRSLGYPWAVARYLTGLCTTATPPTVFTRLSPSDRYDWRTRRLFRDPHLPQGSPTSPALSNLAAWHLDCRLTGLARAFQCNYTRYADDLVFSGDEEFASRANAFIAAVSEIVSDEKFAVNANKTRVMPRSGRQTVTGIVVNDHVNVARNEYDTLKATLFNCVRHGPTKENRFDHHDFQRHLEGRVAWVEQLNPRRGHKLRAMFDTISWPGGT